MSSNPYDVLPVAKSGDAQPEAIYVEVGRACARWEEIEEQLALIFAILLGVDDPTAESSAGHAYGAIATFKARAEMVKAASVIALAEHPKAQADVKKAINLCVSFSARRNEIAHGAVRMFDTIVGERRIKDNGFYLVPPTYNSNKKHPDAIGSIFAQNMDDAIKKIEVQVLRGFGKYKYNSTQIRKYSDEFFKMYNDLKRLGGRLQEIRT